MKKIAVAIVIALMLAAGSVQAEQDTRRLKAFNYEIDGVIIEINQGAGWQVVAGLTFTSYLVDNLFPVDVRPYIPYNMRATWYLGENSGECTSGPFTLIVDITGGCIE